MLKYMCLLIQGTLFHIHVQVMTGTGWIRKRKADGCTQSKWVEPHANVLNILRDERWGETHGSVCILYSTARTDYKWIPSHQLLIDHSHVNFTSERKWTAGQTINQCFRNKTRREMTWVSSHTVHLLPDAVQPLLSELQNIIHSCMGRKVDDEK